MPRESVPPALLSAVEEVLGSDWQTIDRGEAAYVPVCADSVEAAKSEYGL